MKKLSTLLGAFALSLGLFAQSAQTQLMQVTTADGTKSTYKVDAVQQVDFITFDANKLTNQYALNFQPAAINQVEMQLNSGTYTFQLLAEAGDTVATIHVPEAQINKEFSLSNLPEGAAFSSQLLNVTDADVKVSFDKFKKNVTIAFDAIDAAGTSFNGRYYGAFTETFAVSSTFTYQPIEGDAANYDIATMLYVAPSAVGEASTFAFCDVEAATPADFLNAHAAVRFSLSAAKLYSGTIDLATETSSYTLSFIDYATGTVYDKVISGSLLSEKKADGQTYFKLSATFEDGQYVEAEYLGTPVTTTDDIEAIIPLPVMDNGFTLYNADGNANVKSDITEVQSAVSSGLNVLYFLGSEANNVYNCPVLKFADSLVNAGKIDLSTLAPNTFAISYKNIGLYSPDNEWKPSPDNGTLSIEKDDAGNYNIYLEVVNSYNMNGYVGGDKYRLVISYQGQVVPKN